VHKGRMRCRREEDAEQAGRNALLVWCLFAFGLSRPFSPGKKRGGQKRDRDLPRRAFLASDRILLNANKHLIWFAFFAPVCRAPTRLRKAYDRRESCSSLRLKVLRTRLIFEAQNSYAILPTLAPVSSGCAIGPCVDSAAGKVQESKMHWNTSSNQTLG
jgi:hypothetical protein